jgi:hypothetical protein
LKLKNYFQIGIGAGLLIALVGIILWVKGGYSHPQAEAPTADVGEVDDTNADDRLEEDLAAKAQNDDRPSADAKKKSEPVDMNKASEFFAQAMRQLTTCAGVSTGSPADHVEPTFENIAGAIKSDVGEPILRSEDWTVWNLRASGGEERRIRIETDYSDSDQTSRHLLYFKLDPQGNPTLIPLPADSTKNPSDAFVASLQKDGDVYEEEKGERAYFDGGQEMVVTQRNGHIDDLEFANGSKTFRCAGVLTGAPSCKCY